METKKAKRGFAAMDKELQKQLAIKGGKSAQAKGVAHRFTSEEAKKAGKRRQELLAEAKRTTDGTKGE